MRFTRAIIASAALAIALSGCTQLRTHQGYIVDQALVDSVASAVLACARRDDR